MQRRLGEVLNGFADILVGMDTMTKPKSFGEIFEIYLQRVLD